MLIKRPCHLLGEGFERCSLVIYSKALTDCWVFNLNGLSSNTFQILCLPLAVLITPRPMTGCDHTFNPFLHLDTKPLCANSNLFFVRGNK